MQTVSQGWLDTNAAPFCNESIIQATLYHKDRNALILDDQWIMNFKHTMNGSILTGSLPEIKISVTFDNQSGIFPYDASADSYRNNRIVFRYGFAEYIEGEKIYATIDGASLFVRNPIFDEDKQTVTLECVDILSLMTETYSGSRTGDGYEIVQAVLYQAENSSIVPLISITSYLDETALRAADIEIPQNKHYSLRDVLQLVANAAMCVITVDRKSGIHIFKLTDIDGSLLVDLPAQQYTIARNISYSTALAEVNPQINHLTVVYNNNQMVATLDLPEIEGQEQSLDNPIMVNDNEVDFHVSFVGLWIYNTLESARTSYSGRFRADPRADLFDIVFVETKSTGTIPCILTSLSMEYTGGWSGTYKAVSADIGNNITDINSLELLTINELETYTLNELEGN